MYNCMEVIRKDNETIGLIKAYASFSGKGAFPTEVHGKEAEILQQFDQEYSKTPEKHSRCGWMDILMLKRFIQENNITVLAISHWQVLGELKTQMVCEAYRCRHRLIKEAPSDLEECMPIYKSFLGDWHTSNCKKWYDVHDRAKRYIAYLERKAGIPIRYIKFDPRSDKLVRIPEEIH